MPKQNFVAGTTPTIGAVWLNKVDTLFVDAFAEAQTAAGVRSALGATTVGDGVFRAASAAAARTVLGSTAVGDGVFIAASEAAARSVLGLAAGLAGDIWVKKAGDTMTGPLVINIPGFGGERFHIVMDSLSYLDVSNNASAPRIEFVNGIALIGFSDTFATEKFRLRSSDGAFLWSPPASITLLMNGQITIEFTNNTTLTLKAKGSDGIVRSAAIPLS